jgi:hypothetical protein
MMSLMNLKYSRIYKFNIEWNNVRKVLKNEVIKGTL